MPRVNAIGRLIPVVFTLVIVLLGLATKVGGSPLPFPKQSTEADSASKPSQSAVPQPLPRGKKLFLTDGNFQIVREYSVEGDRVRYWSVERSAWEEIPTSLVDWDATHKAEAAQAQQEAALKAKVQASEAAARYQEITIDRSVEIKPGIFLPDEAGFYLLDGTRVHQMTQDTAVSKIDKRRAAARIITGVPLIPSKQIFELAGERATLRVSSNDPEFYIRPADQREPRFMLVRAEIKGGYRVLDSTSQYIYGEQGHQNEEIEFQTWTPANGVFRYTLSEQLMPGEYAFLESTAEGVSVYVWDFGVDPPKAGKK